MSSAEIIFFLSQRFGLLLGVYIFIYVGKFGFYQAKNENPRIFIFWLIIGLIPSSFYAFQILEEIPDFLSNLLSYVEITYIQLTLILYGVSFILGFIVRSKVVQNFNKGRRLYFDIVGKGDRWQECYKEKRNLTQLEKVKKQYEETLKMLSKPEDSIYIKFIRFKIRIIYLLKNIFRKHSDFFIKKLIGISDSAPPEAELLRNQRLMTIFYELAKVNAAIHNCTEAKAQIKKAKAQIDMMDKIGYDWEKNEKAEILNDLDTLEKEIKIICR